MPLCVHECAELQGRPVPETAAFLFTPKPALFPKCFLIIRRHIFPHRTWLLFLYFYMLAAVQTLSCSVMQLWKHLHFINAAWSGPGPGLALLLSQPPSQLSSSTCSVKQSPGVNPVCLGLCPGDVGTHEGVRNLQKRWRSPRFSRQLGRWCGSSPDSMLPLPKTFGLFLL